MVFYSASPGSVYCDFALIKRLFTLPDTCMSVLMAVSVATCDRKRLTGSASPTLTALSFCCVLVPEAWAST